MKDSRISISCAALARIIIDDKYLLLMNKGKYGPIGGALKYDKEAIVWILDKIDYKPERTGEDFYDLRINIPEHRWNKFKKWFNRGQLRETTINRELVEELQPYLKSDISKSHENICHTVETSGDILKDNAHNTVYKNRIFQIHDVILSKDAEKEVRKIVENNDDLILATKEEIKKSLRNISQHSKHIVL